MSGVVYTGGMLLVDGYNVLMANMPPSLAGLDEGGLCMVIARVGLARGGAVVVCDGKPKPLGAIVSPVGAVELVFSGPRKSADDVLIEMIQASSFPKRLVVVSNDRAIISAAKKRKARVQASEAFIQSVASRLDTGPGGNAGWDAERPGEKRSGGTLSADQVQGWLEAFGLEED